MTIYEHRMAIHAVASDVGDVVLAIDNFDTPSDRAQKRRLRYHQICERVSWTPLWTIVSFLDF